MRSSRILLKPIVASVLSDSVRNSLGLSVYLVNLGMAVSPISAGS